MHLIKKHMKPLCLEMINLEPLCSLSAVLTTVDDLRLARCSVNLLEFCIQSRGQRRT
jgi:hypothetical protein